MALAKALRCIGSLPESFFFCFLDWFCVCLLVSSVSRSHAYAVKVPATDRQTDRHTVRAAPGAVLAPGPEAMWKARSGFSSTRTNLSPFTKDFRAGEHPRVYGIFGSSASAAHHPCVYRQVCSLFSSLFLWHVPPCVVVVPQGMAMSSSKDYLKCGEAVQIYSSAL